MTCLSGHQSSRMKSDVWLTPPEILKPLGKFDLDPCAPPDRPWDTARDHISLPVNGLEADWWGRIWLNPPFGSHASLWLKKLSQHGDGIALVAARTETKMFFDYVWPVAHAILFIKGRPHFHYADGERAPFNSGAPICLIGYGTYNMYILAQSGLGKFIKLKTEGVKP